MSHSLGLISISNLADFDYRQSMAPDEPGAWYAVLPLEVVYAFDPIPPARPVAPLSDPPLQQPPHNTTTDKGGHEDKCI